MSSTFLWVIFFVFTYSFFGGIASFLYERFMHDKFEDETRIVIAGAIWPIMLFLFFASSGHALLHTLFPEEKPEPAKTEEEDPDRWETPPEYK